MTTEFDPSELDDPRDPLPPGCCLHCGRYWHFCGCSPDDPAYQRRVKIERALRDNDDITARNLMEMEED